MYIRSYRDLHVWQRSIELVERIYAVTKTFPRDETYGLTSQLRRAAVSISSNIAEGHAKASSKEYLRHISMSLGSLAETDTQLEIASRLGYLSHDDFIMVANLADEVGKMLRGVQQSMRRKPAGRNNHPSP